MISSSLPKFDPTAFAWMAAPSGRFPCHRLPVTAGMEAVWETQTPPRFPPGLDQPEDAEALYCWWLIDGVRSHPHVPFHFEEAFLSILGEAITLHEGFALPLWLYRYWQSSHLLQERFDPADESSAAGLLIWAYTANSIPSELLRALPLPEESLEFLSQNTSGGAFPLPRALKALWDTNVQGARRYDITAPEGCAALAIWFLLYQKNILPFLPVHFDPSLAADLLKHNEEGVPYVAEGTLLVRPDARPLFSLRTPQERDYFYGWLSTEALSVLRSHPLIQHVLHVLAPSYPTQPPEPADSLPAAQEEKAPLSAWLKAWHSSARNQLLGETERGGVNIIGFAKGELGLGEDVRMAAKACEQGNVPFVLFDPPFAIASRQNDRTVEHLIVDAPRYAVNLTFLPGIETLRLFFNSGSKLFNKRYNIGAWQWELPNWPQALKRALPLAQEFWASTKFVMDIMQAVTRAPLFHMPMVVELPPFERQSRAAHTLPEDAFLFLYVFDGLSWGARKNPLGAIKAFQDAFPSRRDVRFIIKTMNASPDMSFWRAVLEEAAKDKRIVCINEIYSKQQLLSLFSCCDAYVSLHRSEGFGRTIAEAMLLERPVIATAWSGNADFTTQDTAFAIGGKMIPLQKDEYIFWEGQHWCDPDHDEAVTAMRECVGNPALAQTKARAGRRHILDHYAAAVVGSCYKKRLMELGI